MSRSATTKWVRINNRLEAIPRAADEAIESDEDEELANGDIVPSTQQADGVMASNIDTIKQIDPQTVATVAIPSGCLLLGIWFAVTKPLKDLSDLPFDIVLALGLCLLPFGFLVAHAYYAMSRAKKQQ